MKTIAGLVLGILSLVISVAAETARQDTSKIEPNEIANPSQSVSISGTYWRSGLHTTVPIVGGMVLASQGGLVSAVGGLSILYGAFIGPSVGNFYVEDHSGGMGGIAWRAGGAASTLVGFAIAIGCAFSGDGGDCKAQEPFLYVSLIGGAGAYVGGTIWQLTRIPSHARQKNRLGLESASPSVQNKFTALSWNLSPTWNPTRQTFGAQFALNLPGL